MIQQLSPLHLKVPAILLLPSFSSPARPIQASLQPSSMSGGSIAMPLGNNRARCRLALEQQAAQLCSLLLPSVWTELSAEHSTASIIHPTPLKGLYLFQVWHALNTLTLLITNGRCWSAREPNQDCREQHSALG